VIYGLSSVHLFFVVLINQYRSFTNRAAGLEVTASISSSLPAAGDKATQKRSIVDVMGGQYRIGSRQVRGAGVIRCAAWACGVTCHHMLF
jgi:hypothetical protein